MENYERILIEEALTHHQYNARATAKALGLEYQTLYNKMKKHGLTRKQLRLSWDGTRDAADYIKEKDNQA
jgi:DNA-binding NtrC family response regulator